MSSPGPQNCSARLATAKKYISLFATLDGPSLSTLLASNYHHEFLPHSMNPPGPFSKLGFLEHYSHLKDIMSGFTVTGHEYIESESSNAVTVLATSQTAFRRELRDQGLREEEWEYRGEYVFVIYVSEDGREVVKVVEFLDSKATMEKLMPLNKRAKANSERIRREKENVAEL
jgi:hypothetical protein